VSWGFRFRRSSSPRQGRACPGSLRSPSHTHPWWGLDELEIRTKILSSLLTSVSRMMGQPQDTPGLVSAPFT